MEIHTNNPKAQRRPEAGPASEHGKYLRRKATQKLRRSHIAGRRLMNAVRLAAKLGAFLLVLVLSLSVLFYAYSSDRFALRNVTFYGSSHLDTEPLKAKIIDKVPSNLLRIDLVQVRRLVQDEVWVRQAEIRRVLPSDLLIYVQERVPSVIVEMNGILMIADDQGVLLDQYDPKYGKLDVPVFKGVAGNNAREYRLYQDENSSRIRLGSRLLSELDSGEHAFSRDVSEVDISDKNNLKVMLVDGSAEIWLGDRDFLRRLSMLMSNMNQYRQLRDEGRDIGIVDLRFGNQIIYKIRNTSAKHTVSAKGFKQ